VPRRPARFNRSARITVTSHTVTESKAVEATVSVDSNRTILLTLSYLEAFTPAAWSGFSTKDIED
jgi:hypothetical protein